MNHKNSAHKVMVRSLLAAGLLSATSVFAASGQFTFVTGDVRVVTAGNRTVQATRGMDVNAGDVIITGTDGMAQLAMVDAARLSLRSGTQMRVESYARAKEGTENSVLTLLRGTMRTFTGLLSPSARDRFAMKTRVATVGIRGSGNILYHADGACPEEQGAGGQAGCTINHTIEGSHNVFSEGFPTPFVSGPGQTVLVLLGQQPRTIPTPPAILEAGRIMTGKTAPGDDPAQPPEESRNFAAADAGSTTTQQRTGGLVGNNGLGFTVTDASGNLGGTEPLGLRELVVAGGTTISTQATGSGLTLQDGALRGFTSYPGLQGGFSATISGGTLQDGQSVNVGGTTVQIGRWSGADLSVLGTSFGTLGSVHFAYGSAGFPAYLSEVLTGTATYTLAAATSPTNQFNTAGTLGSATLNVNFSNRTLNAALAVNLPGNGNNAGGAWNLAATNVPISLGNFFASTADRLVITNGNGQSSASNTALFGSLEGSFVGTGLGGAILGYSFSDQTSSNANNFNTVSGTAVLSGTAQRAAAEFRIGLVSDVAGILASSPVPGSLLVVNRPDEVTQGTTPGAVTAFAGPARFAATGFFTHASYQQGSSTLNDVGFDASTGLSWGRWSGGAATLSSGNVSQNVALGGQNLHYIVAATQSGPTALPLTGTASYDVVGSTRPTDGSGHVGTFNSATLNANFSARTVDLGVNFTNQGQTWNASASSVPIYRDLYFAAFTGGGPGAAQLNINCTPNCGQNARGSVEGFFTGRSGEGAGMMYNVGGNNGAVALRRRGG